MSKPKGKRLNFNFRYQPYENTTDGKLISYLNLDGEETDQELSSKEMILWALRAFWQPFAHRYHAEQVHGGVSEEQLKRSARRAIYRLREHIAYLQEVFDLQEQEPAPYSYPGNGQGYPGQPAPPRVPTSPQGRTARSPEFDLGMGDLMRDDDDDLVRQSFK